MQLLVLWPPTIYIGGGERIFYNFFVHLTVVEFKSELRDV
jgi:hypothetical protein